MSDTGGVALVIGGADSEQLAGDLSKRGFLTRTTAGLGDACALLDGGPFEVILIDWAEPSARDVLSGLTERFPDATTIVLAEGGVAAVVEAMRAGADDVVQKPVELEELVYAVQKALAASEVAQDVPSTAAQAPRGLVGDSRPMQQVHEKIQRAAPGMATVLIRGESGTGKEVIARAIHEQSPRKDKPMVKLHCGALPDTLLESELFGYEKGAFTGAVSRKPGRVEVAQGGTLFLDEIGDITQAMQVKLLRMLQEREYERLGSTETRKADVRFIAATHRDLEGMVKRGDFREDLFYRLNVVPLWLPPLRARRDDVEALARHFCQTFGEANARAGITLGDDAVAELESQRWPGNVRQLQNFVERLVVLTEGQVIGADDVKREISQQTPFSTQATRATGARAALTGEATQSQIIPLSEEVRAAEKKALQRALKHTKGNRTLAARILGVSRATLYNKIEDYGLS